MDRAYQISKVALAGKGRFGSVVLTELLKAGFQITVLTRSASSLKDIPAGVEVSEVDYNSGESLRQALKGHDAVVSTVAGAAVATQKPMIDAAIAVGVKHFIPADYAMSLKSPGVRLLPPYTDVLEIENYLRQRSDKMDWTIVACSAFLEYLFDLPFVVDIKNRKMDIVNGGNVPFSVSEFSTAAKAVAGVLKEPGRVDSHSIQVHGMLITQNETLELIKKHDPDVASWTICEENGSAKFDQGLDMLKRGEFTMEAVTTLMAGVIWGQKYVVAFEETDNDWLGIEMTPKERLDEVIKVKVTDGITSIASEKIVSSF